MRAAVCRAFGEPLRIEEVRLDPPARGQLRVRLEACAICHSDIAYARGDWGGALPAVFGHEAAGRVVARGADVHGYADGERVLVTLLRACGDCPACAGGAPTACRVTGEGASPIRCGDGAPLHQGLATAAFAEEVVVDASQCVSLPEDLPPDLACLLACGVITGVGAVRNTAAVPRGASVAVIGAGGVGLNALQGAAISGAAPIVAVDIAPEKLAVARTFGATDALIAGPDLPDRVRTLTGGRGFDFVFVAVGAPQAMAQAPDLLAVGGAVVILGMLGTGTRVPYDPTSLAAANQRILGSRMGQTVLARDVPWLIDEWRAGRLKLAELVSERYPLDRINEAIAATCSGMARRNVIVFGDG